LFDKIQNITNPGERALVINGGTFGKKWGTMCQAFGLEVDELHVGWGKNPDLNALDAALKRGVNHLFATAHETSTGYHYDIEAIAALAKAHGSTVIVDAVSSLGADEFHMDAWKCDCVLASTQKALACMPGLSFIAFSDEAQELSRNNSRHKYYFDFQEYADNAVRGMIPYTPAISVTLQLRERLRRIRELGISNYIDQHHSKAMAFRDAVLGFAGFSLFPERSSNSMSAIRLPDGANMSAIVDKVYRLHGWRLAPNPTKDESYIRVSHMGSLTEENLILMAERIKDVCDGTA